jgi:hypothetical protein
MVEHVLPRLRPTCCATRSDERSGHGTRGASGPTASVGSGTPPKVFAARYGRVLDQAKGLTMGRATCVALGPTSHRARQHGGRHPGRAESEARQLGLIGTRGWTAVPDWKLVEPFSDRLNPDGVHGPAEAHAMVGRAVARPIDPCTAPRA